MIVSLAMKLGLERLNPVANSHSIIWFWSIHYPQLNWDAKFGLVGRIQLCYKSGSVNYLSSLQSLIVLVSVGRPSNN